MISDIEILNGVMFTSPTLGRMSVRQITKDIAGFVHKDADSFYRLVIGTDSQVKKANGKFVCDYVTAIVIHKTGSGAKYYWRNIKGDKPVTLREKIYNETMISLSTAHYMVPDLRKSVSAVKHDLEIHIDVGSLGPTREMIKEVVGMVTGNGFTVKTKPESWGASSVADKHT